jgi:hypothetical protein
MATFLVLVIGQGIDFDAWSPVALGDAVRFAASRGSASQGFSQSSLNFSQSFTEKE